VTDDEKRGALKNAAAGIIVILLLMMFAAVNDPDEWDGHAWKDLPRHGDTGRQGQEKSH
jgi:hypothetical protein